VRVGVGENESMARAARRLLTVESRYNVWKIKYPLRPAKYHFGTEAKAYRELSKRWYTEALERQGDEPVKLHEYGGRTWWWFKKQVYVESEGLSSADVKALALQLQRSKDATLERAHAELRGEALAGARPREPISEAVRHEVWRRDQGRCVDCGSRENLEFDHIVPWSEGGSNTVRNLELRCESCNAKKGARI
jgi:5-methylcytosine-specific restriction endonuclease McrA